MAEKKTKREKFEDLAEKRVTEAIKRLRLIGNLANKNNYDYTEGHVKQILSALNGELRSLKKRFGSGTLTDEAQFTFSTRNA